MSLAKSILFCGDLLALSADASAVPMSWSAVGNPGNAADPATGFGRVDYAFKIGTYEVTNNQYSAFLNAVARVDTYGLYNTDMSGDTSGGITRANASGNFAYAVKAGRGEMPVNFVSWGDAARFSNWLQNGQPTGAQTAATTEGGSYSLNGATSNTDLLAVTRTPNAQFVIPTENEWYKAAYYDPYLSTYHQFATRTDDIPSNSYGDLGNNATYWRSGFTKPNTFVTDVGHFSASVGPYGTYDQDGNVSEWNETLVDINIRGVRGGAWSTAYGDLMSTLRSAGSPTYEAASVGFREANVPEPSTFALAAFGFIALAWRLRRHT